jgi:hypothetical protein
MLGKEKTMKTIILLLATLCYFLVLASGAEYQQGKKQSTSEGKASSSQEGNRRSAETAQTSKAVLANPLDRLEGKWKFHCVTGILGVSSNGLQIGTRILTADQKDIKRPDSNTISFAFSWDPEYTLTLRRQAVSPRYLLTIKVASSLYVENLPLVYSEKEGFTSQPSAPGSAEPEVSAKITFDGSGGHKWLISPGFEITFTKPKEQETKNP